MATNNTTTTTTISTGSYLNADTVNTTLPSTTTCHEANYHNAPTNVKMTLADARTELESHGFIILEQQEQQELLSSSSRLLVGCRSECRWHSTGKVDMLVFVQELASSNEEDPLTVTRIQEDLQKLKTDWLLSLPSSFYSPSGCPPHGISRGRIILMVYLTQQQQPISSEVAWYLTQKPPSEWCQLTLVAAQDGSNGASYYYSQETPMWGRAFYPEVRYWAALLTGRRPLPEKPSPYNICLILINIYCIVLLYVTYPPNTLSGRKFWLITIGITVALTLVAFAYHECQRRRHDAAMTNNNNKMNVKSSTTGASATMGDSLV